MNEIKDWPNKAGIWKQRPKGHDNWSGEINWTEEMIKNRKSIDYWKNWEFKFIKP